jgi:hypothetical protein
MLREMLRLGTMRFIFMVEDHEELSQDIQPNGSLRYRLLMHESGAKESLALATLREV